MVVAVAVQHVVLDRLQPRRAQLLRFDLRRRQREPRITDEPLVVEENRGDVVVLRDEPDRRLAVEAGLVQDRLALADLREDGVGIGAELGGIEVVLAPGRRHHGQLRLRGRG